MYFGGIVEELDSERLVSDSMHPYTWSLLDAVPSVEARDTATPGETPVSVERAETLGVGCRFAPRCPYATELCRTQSPPLRPVGRPDHAVACHYAGELMREASSVG